MALFFGSMYFVMKGLLGVSWLMIAIHIGRMGSPLRPDEKEVRGMASWGIVGIFALLMLKFSGIWVDAPIVEVF